MHTIVAPAPGTELIAWMSDHMDAIKAGLSDKGLVLLRGFDTEKASTLREVLGLFGTEPLTDARWSTPRSAVGNGVFTSTEYPAEQRILLHSEMSYSRTWARILLFQCKIAAQTGGATTIANLQAVSDELGDVVNEFHEREVMYLRTFRKGLDIPWQDAFGTEDRDEILEIGKRSGLEVEWKADGTLHTVQQAQGAVEGPQGPLWFNQAHLFHPSQLPAATRKTLVSMFGEGGLPRAAIFGDGGSIPDETIERILEVLKKNTRSIDWQSGDVSIIDNMRWMHGRSPYTGNRKVLAAMGRAQMTPALTPIVQ